MTHQSAAGVGTTSGETTNITYREALLPLTSLRFLAALFVLISHYAQEKYLSPGLNLYYLLDEGRSAVVLFFVLSGFILTYNYEGRLNDKNKIKSYFGARFARIYPVCLLSLAIASINVFYLIGTNNLELMARWHQVKTHVVASFTLSLISQLLLIVAWFPLGVITESWNAPAWSLSCEAFFYVLFPYLLKGMKSLSNRSLAVSLLCLWAAQGGWIWANNMLWPEPRNLLMVYKFPVSHLFDFVLGMSVGLWFLQLSEKQKTQYRRLSQIGVVVALLLVGLLSYFSPVWPPYFLVTPVFALLIISMANANASLPLLCLPLLVLLGEASYSLYMIHYPLVRLYELFHVPRQYGLLLTVMTIGVSILVFKCYEEPARKFIRARLAARKM